MIKKIVFTILALMLFHSPCWAQQEINENIKSEDLLESAEQSEGFVKDSSEKLAEFYKENKAWFEEKRKTQQRIFLLAEEAFKIAQDKEIQQTSLKLFEKFKFKPFLLAQALLLVFTWVYRSTRPGNRGFLIRMFEQFLISQFYIVCAVLIVPTIFLGTEYLELLWTLIQKVIILFKAAQGPMG